MRDGFKISVVFAAAVVVIVWAASPQFMYLLVGDEKEIVRIGVRYLHIVSPDIPFLRQPLPAHEFPTRGGRDCIPGF